MATIKTVGVTCASGCMGQAQILQLLAAGHIPRVFSRSWNAPGDEFCDVEASETRYQWFRLLSELALFFCNITTLFDINAVQFAQNFIRATNKADVPRIIHNTGMWAPYKPCEAPQNNTGLELENIITGSSIEVTALDRQDLIGKRFVIGGREVLPNEEIVVTLFWSLGRPIHCEYITPFELGAILRFRIMLHLKSSAGSDMILNSNASRGLATLL